MGTNPKYDRQTRQQIRKRILSFYREGLGYEAMTEKLKQEGFSAPNGSELKTSTVVCQGLQAGIRLRRKSKRDKKQESSVGVSFTPVGPQTDADVLIDLVLAAKVPAETKVNLIKNLRAKT